jgi:pimeloyl-ACP methyl ester carboxylesterase
MSDTITIGRLTADSAQPAPSRGAHPPILFLHGFLAGAWIYESYLPFFAERGFPGFALNLRGRAGSGLPDGASLGRVSMADFIEDGREAARWLTDRLGKPIVFGHSMGGLVAQKLAEEGLARALVLLSPAPPRGISVLSGPLLRRQLRYLPALLRSKPVVPRWRDVRDLVLNRVPSADQQKTFARFVADSGRAGREMSFGSVAVNANRVRENECPVLVVTSDDDRFVPAHIAQRVAERYHAPVFMSRGHGHLMLYEPGWNEGAAFIADWIRRELGA